MRENGYASDISTFLNEIVVPNEFKIKFRNKYGRAASQTRYPTFVPYFVPYFVLFSTDNHSPIGKGFGKQETHQIP